MCFTSIQITYFNTTVAILLVQDLSMIYYLRSTSSVTLLHNSIVELPRHIIQLRKYMWHLLG